MRTVELDSSDEDENEIIVYDQPQQRTHMENTPPSCNIDCNETIGALHTKAASLQTESTLLTSLGRILHDIIPTKLLAIQYDQLR